MTGPQDYGQLGADRVQAVTLVNAAGLRARLITYGARLTELQVPDRDGRIDDIVLGCDTLAGYVASTAYFGATCGRYGNRIAGGQIVIDGADWQLDRNEGINHLHGGSVGFDRKIWAIDRLGPAEVSFVAVSQDGEMGYPGQCELRCTYALTDDNRLRITMEATTTRATVMNMVNHSYFNLAGHGSGDVLGQLVQIAAQHYTPVDASLLATGEVAPVVGTEFDFTRPRPIGTAFEHGYDHNWCLDDSGGQRPGVEVLDPGSGRRLRLTSSEPGLQFYTGGYLHAEMTGKGAQSLCRFAGFTLETQKYPGSPNHAQFPSAILRPGQRYRHWMELAFSTDAQP